MTDTTGGTSDGWDVRRDRRRVAQGGTLAGRSRHEPDGETHRRANDRPHRSAAHHGTGDVPGGTRERGTGQGRHVRPTAKKSLDVAECNTGYCALLRDWKRSGKRAPCKTLSSTKAFSYTNIFCNLTSANVYGVDIAFLAIQKIPNFR